jgi:hypothetical protein
MPTTIAQILASERLALKGVVRWGTKVNSNSCGVYIVSLSFDPFQNLGVLENAPLSRDFIQEWLNKVDTFKLDGKTNPSVDVVASRLSKFWLPDENILYIGKTDGELRKRVGEYYRTPLGAPKPHHGGHWLKLLSNVNQLFVYFSECSNAEAHETQMLKLFVKNVSSATLKLLHDPQHPYPFANLEIIERKAHGISNATYDK